jgi:oligopeptidase B
MQTPETATGIENWKEVIAHRNDTLLEGLELFNGYMVIDERRDGLTHLRIIDLNQNTEHYLDFGESAYSAGVSVNPDFDSQWLRFSYTSLTTPNSTFDYNMVTREKKLLKQQEVVGGYNSEDYQSERIYVKARDGKSIPLSLVYKKSLTPNPQKPLLLYGYGSYGATMDVYFSSVRISLLDRGFTFAIAHIRGGQELGRNWYEDGKLLNKKNTFYDFIDCANYLIEAKYTSEQHLYAMGGSAGGLLMGAVINMAPEVFNGVVAQVPFVDVVTTMLDDSIPLTTGEYDEWGNPNDKQFYDYIKSYSPYDNIESKAYPAMLVTTGLHDSQVQYWEPAKWVARLRELKTDNNILLLQTNLEAGHGGASGRFERIKEIALEYAFLLHLEGIYN